MQEIYKLIEIERKTCKNLGSNTLSKIPKPLKFYLVNSTTQNSLKTNIVIKWSLGFNQPAIHCNI